MVDKAPLDEISSGVTQSGRAKLLVIDDEELMCELLSAMLSSDFEVVVLSSSREAAKRLCSGEVFDLVLCDLMMPELSGMELFTQVQASRPAQAERIVFMTGGSYTDEAHDFLAEKGRFQLQKPFRHDALLAMVRQRLGDLGLMAR